MNKSIFLAGVLLSGCVSAAGNRPSPAVPQAAQKESMQAVKEASPAEDSGPVIKEGIITFKYYDDLTAEEVYIVGDFNNWNKEPMDQTAGVFLKTIQLDPGTYQYKFVVDGNWVLDPENPDTAPDGYGGKNSVVTVK